jgi:hypothetical protein
MVRSYWKGTLVAAALTSTALLAWGQPMLLPTTVSSGQPAQQVQAPAEPIKPVPAGTDPAPNPVPATGTERIITVQDPGCPARQCRVLREWVLAEGSNAMEVQALDNGEKMTIVCGSCQKCTSVGSPQCCPDDYPCARIQGGISKIFKWGRDCCAPADCPKPPLCQPSGPECGPACGPVCGDSCKAKGSLSDMTDKRFIDPCTGKFDYEKYLAELRTKHGECGPQCDACAPPAGPEKIQNMPAPNAKAGTEESRWPILSKIVGHPVGVDAKTDVSVDGKMDAKMTVKTDVKGPAVTTLPPATVSKDKPKTATADASSDSTWKKWFGGDDHPVSGTNDKGDFDKDKYLAELRSKYGSDKSKADTTPAVAKATQPKKEEPKKEDVKVVAKVEPKKPDVKPAPPTATQPKPAAPPAAVAQTKAPEKAPAEPAQPTDWRKSWGKTDSQVAKTDKPAPPPVVKKDPPVAPVRVDPLMDKDMLEHRTQQKTEAKINAVMGSQPKAPVAPPPVVAKPVPAPAPVAVVKEEPAGKASTAKIPMGAGSVMAAYGDMKPGQAVYLPVPMVTMPPNAHMVKPPQGPENLPPAVNQYFANAFSSPDAPVMPAGQDPQMAQNAFGNNPQQGMPMMPPPMMQQAMMQQAMMQQAMMQQAAMQQQGMMPPGMMPPGMMPQGVAQAGYYPMAAPMASPVQPYQQPGCDPQTAQNLMQTLHDSIYPSQREWAAETLSKIDWRMHPQVFDALLTGAREDPAPTVRSCCVRCLSSMNVNSSVLAMTLQGLKNDSDPRVRTEVDQALAKMPQQPTKSAVQPVSATGRE